jgi:uncharacterized protein YjbJ (UPF0337 family)
MNWDQVEGNWKQVKGKVKEQWGWLTDDELDRFSGRRDQLVGKIQESYGYERDRAKREVDEAVRRWSCRASPVTIADNKDYRPFRGWDI